MSGQYALNWGKGISHNILYVSDALIHFILNVAQWLYFLYYDTLKSHFLSEIPSISPLDLNLYILL